jgi:hypothetical protein
LSIFLQFFIGIFWLERLILQAFWNFSGTTSYQNHRGQSLVPEEVEPSAFPFDISFGSLMMGGIAL